MPTSATSCCGKGSTASLCVGVNYTATNPRSGYSITVPSVVRVNTPITVTSTNQGDWYYNNNYVSSCDTASSSICKIGNAPSTPQSVIVELYYDLLRDITASIVVIA